jgi:hypothetical protein
LALNAGWIGRLAQFGDLRGSDRRYAYGLPELDVQSLRQKNWFLNQH